VCILGPDLEKDVDTKIYLPAENHFPKLRIVATDYPEIRAPKPPARNLLAGIGARVPTLFLRLAPPLDFLEPPPRAVPVR
jgi:hypothetical protein